MNPRALDPEALLAEQPWVERLARGLVRDSSLAQDLAQEAWLLAARGAPAVGSLRGYLGGVLRNLKRSARRAEERRGRREALAARPEALPSPAELVERAELQRLLVESVLALEESERTAILLTYFEGLSAEEVSRRASIPSATVRSRVHRGLEHLRARLEARVRREDLLAGLVVLGRLGPAAPAPVPPEPVPAAAGGTTLSWIGGILAMKTLLSLAAGCAALLSLAAGWWLLARDGDGAQARGNARAAGEEVAALRASAPGALATPIEPPPAADRRVALEEEVQPLPPAPPPAPMSAARVEARLVDEAGAPVADVAVARWEERVATSGRDGRVALELPLGAENQFVLLAFTHRGFAREQRGVRLVSGAPIPLGDVVLRRAGTLRGRVEDEHGRGLGGVRVLSTGLEDERTDPEELRRLGPLGDEHSVGTESGPDGSFELAGVRVGPTRVWAGGAGLEWSAVGPLAVTVDGLDDVVLSLRTLERVDRITGRVLAPDGTPVPHARLHTWFMAASFGSGGNLEADAEGRFEILLQQRVAYDLTVADPENRWSEIYAPRVEPGTLDLELSFEPARWIDVAVRDAEGRPVEGYTLGYESATGGNHLQMTARTEPLEPGRVKLRVPNARFRVTAEASGRESLVQGPFEAATPPEALVFDLAALAGVRGSVLSSAGAPVAGAEVGLYREVDARIAVEQDGFRLRTEGWSDAKTTTDAAGRFVLYPPTLRGGRIASERFVLRATAAGHAPTELEPRAYDAKEGAEVELRLLRGGAIEGRARVSPGIDPTGFVLAFHRGDGKTRTVRLGPDARYRVEGLTPGGWSVLALDDEIHGNRSSSSSTYYEEGAPEFEPWDCFVEEGATTRHDLDLTDRAPCTLRGTLALASRALDGWTATLEPAEDDTVLASVALDGDGRFALLAPRGGEYRLVLRGPDEGHGRLELRETLALAPGEREWRLELRPGRLSGSGALGRGTRERFYVYSWSGSAAGHALTAEVRLVPDADGRFLLPTVPEGPGKISRNDPVAEGQDFAPWEVVAEFSVPPGAAQSVVIP